MADTPQTRGLFQIIDRKTLAQGGLMSVEDIRRIYGQNRQAQGNHQHPNPQPITISVRNAFHSFHAPAITVEATRQDPLPSVDETMPILAHRAARLVEGVGGLRLKAMTYPETLSVEMDARCNSPFATIAFSELHKAPYENCACGFYSVPLGDPLDYDDWHVDLLVELSGKVLRCGPDDTGPAGYRAEHQRIVEVRIPPCGLCSRPTQAVFLGNGGRSRCKEHAANWWIGRDDLARSLPVPVTYLGE